MDKKTLEIKNYLSDCLNLLKTDMSFKDLYYFNVLRHGNKKAIEYLDEYNKIKIFTFKKLDKDTRRIASIISDLLKNQNKNKPVILKLKNSPYWIEYMYAILMNGFSPLLISNKTNKINTINLIKKSNACAIITDDPFSYEIIKIDIDVISTLKPKNEFAPTWGKEIILCSSGTTGDVKLIVYSDKNVCHLTMESFEFNKDINDMMYPNKYGNIKNLSMIPFHHIFGFMVSILYFPFYGKTIVIPSTINFNTLRNLCIKRKITHIFSVPLFYESIATQFIRKKKLLNENKISKIDAYMNDRAKGINKTHKLTEKIIKKSLLGSKIKLLVTGGGYLSTNASKVINSLGYPLYNGYGLTEVGISSANFSTNINDRTLPSIGKPFYGLTFKIKNNELLIKSPGMHQKEIINGRIIKAPLDKEGFFATGDIAEIDKQGRYYIKGRIKDVIINSDGENVFPDELELYFKDIKNVNDFTVLGIKDTNNKQKEIISLAVSINKFLDNNDIGCIHKSILNLNNKLPLNSRIQDIYFIKKDLPKSNNGKIKRFEIASLINKGCKDYFKFIKEKKTARKEILKEDNETLIKVKKLCSKILNIPTNKIKSDAHWINDLGGNSMLFIEYISSIEKEFDIIIPSNSFFSCMVINDLAQLIISQKTK